jgi:periplasmic divalent cation tolerance protein
MVSEYCIVNITCPEEAAEDLALNIFKAKLAACMHISAPFQSLYEWEGKIERGVEVMLGLNTRKDKYKEIEAFVLQHHPYECPSITVHSFDDGYKEYFSWIDQSIR